MRQDELNCVQFQAVHISSRQSKRLFQARHAGAYCILRVKNFVWFWVRPRCAVGQLILGVYLSFIADFPFKFGLPNLLPITLISLHLPCERLPCARNHPIPVRRLASMPDTAKAARAAALVWGIGEGWMIGRSPSKAAPKTSVLHAAPRHTRLRKLISAALLLA
jgi:hypothetical protein